ncbi:MAG: hypothetical protein NZM25_00375 [Leptospiraceae bacterium]|nr:hypothetical protein [Leptospiraceae bacterium]
MSYWSSWQHSQLFLFLFKKLGVPKPLRLLQLVFFLLSSALFLLCLLKKLSLSRTVAYSFFVFAFFFPVQHPWYYFLFFFYLSYFYFFRKTFLLLTILIGWNYLSYTPLLEKSVWPQFFLYFLSLASFGFSYLQKLLHHSVPSKF